MLGRTPGPDRPDLAPAGGAGPATDPGAPADSPAPAASPAPGPLPARPATVWAGDITGRDAVH
ncbi:hypothetical protein TBS_22940 [Thermobispora bispora]